MHLLSFLCFFLFLFALFSSMFTPTAFLRNAHTLAVCPLCFLSTPVVFISIFSSRPPYISTTPTTLSRAGYLRCTQLYHHPVPAFRKSYPIPQTLRLRRFNFPVSFADTRLHSFDDESRAQKISQALFTGRLLHSSLFQFTKLLSSLE